MTHRTTSWNAPYTFSGKEKDVETGYGYFGARYYDSGLSIWLSVDPMAENTPFASPYAYCINNPIIFLDPDGQDWFVNENTGQVFFNSEMGKNAAGTGNLTFQAWQNKGLDVERTNAYEMDFAGKSSAFMSKMGYDKVLKSAIAKVTTTVSSIPDVEGPNPKSSKNVELSDCKYTYAKKGSIQSYNAKQLTASRVSTSLELQTSTSVYKEFRQFSYSIPKPKLNIKADSFNVLKGYKRGYVY